jgi:flagellin-like hook-associated protein FlgL
MQGLKLNEFRTQSERTNVSLRDYSDGIYLIQIETNGLKSVKKVLKN